jgi:hypothetical protein
MRNQVLSIVALSIAIIISPGTSFAKGGGGHPGGNTATGGHGWGGNVNQKPPAGNNNKAGSKTINCQAGGAGCQRQH